MASIKVILRTDKKNSRGESPLFIRIIKNRKASNMAIGVYLQEKDWDDTSGKVKKSNRNSGRLNAIIARKIADAQAEIVVQEAISKHVSSKKLKESIMGGAPVDFFEYSKSYVNSMELAGQIGTWQRVKAVIAKLKAFHGDNPLYLDDIDNQLLKKFEDYLVGIGNKKNTIHANLRVIRKIMNDAVADGKLSRDANPFLYYTLKQEPTRVADLLDEEILKIENLILGDNGMIQASRDIFVFACYTGGLRISDLLALKWKNISDGKINLEMKKTGYQLVVKMPDKALAIIERYRPNNQNADGYVFPFLTPVDSLLDLQSYHAQIKRKTSIVNKYLKEIAGKAGISKHISSKVSRHTFATSALRKGVRIEYVSKLLGHTSLAQTQVYAKIVNAELDKAMDVFNE
jgi:integrase/recombinase XerD